MGCDDGNSQKEESSASTNNNKLIKTQNTQILTSLTSHSPELVQQVQLMVGELEKIAVMWDEDWATLLSQLAPDVAARFRY